MSGVLLDTHVFLFLADEAERVPIEFRRAVDQADERYLSAASAWEMAVKSSLGKLRLPESPDRYISSRSSQLLLRSLPISQRHATRAGGLPALHRDPFDRMLVAQALEESLVLLTLDPRVLQYDVRTVHVDKQRVRQRGR